MREEKIKILRELGEALSSISEAWYMVGNTEEVQLDELHFNEANEKLEEASNLIRDARNIIQVNMKGE